MSNPIGVPVRPFAVPITEPFVRAAVEILQTFTELANRSFPSPPDGKLPAGALVTSEADELLALGEPLASARRNLHSLLLNTATSSWSNAVDHVRAVAHDVAMVPPPVWSPLTLTRAVLESCLLTEYLLDPTISISMRICRYAGIWHRDLDHKGRLAQALDEGNLAAQEKAEVESLFAAARLQPRIDRKGKANGYGLGAENAPGDLNITERAAKVLPKWLPAPYVLLSGAAHGRPWMVQRASFLGAGTPDGFVGEAATIMTAVMCTMGALEAVMPSWAGQFGLDLTSVVESMEKARNDFLLRAVRIVHPDMPVELPDGSMLGD